MAKKLKKDDKSLKNSVEAIANLLQAAGRVTVQFTDFIMPETANNVIFEHYVKGFLMNRNLKLGEFYEIQVFTKLKKLQFLEAFSTSTEPLLEFSINTETKVEIIQNLTSAFSKLSLSDLKYPKTIDTNSELEKKVNKEVALVGFEKELSLIYKMIELSLFSEMDKFCHNIESINSKLLFRGVLVTGGNGYGKSHFLKYLSNSGKFEGLRFLDLNVLEIVKEDGTDKDSISKTDKIKLYFDIAKNMAPAVIVVDDIDKIFPGKVKGEEPSTESTNPLLLKFLSEITSLSLSDKVFIVASSSSQDSLDSTLLKVGFFDFTIPLIAPDRSERFKLWEHFLSNYKHSIKKEEIEVFSDISHGYVPSDILNVCKSSVVMSYSGEKTCLDRIDVENSIRNFKPITLKDIILDIPKVFWSDIGGNKKLIKQIQQSVEWPLKNPQVFKNLGITPPNGILLYGPPGCSKTMIAKAIATESGLNFMAVKGPELFSKYVGDSEKAIRDIFKKAKLSSPSIIFFDEIDSMATQRGGDSHVSDKVLCQLLNELDGVEGRERVIIVGATNRPDILDKALIRPGRFDRLIYVPPPDREAREDILKINLKKLKARDVKIDEFLDKTEGFSGAEINFICKEAGMLALDEDINASCIEHRHFEKAIHNIKPIITQEMIDFFVSFATKQDELK